MSMSHYINMLLIKKDNEYVCFFIYSYISELTFIILKYKENKLFTKFDINTKLKKRIYGFIHFQLY